MQPVFVPAAGRDPRGGEFAGAGLVIIFFTGALQQCGVIHNLAITYVYGNRTQVRCPSRFLMPFSVEPFEESVAKPNWAL